VKYASSKPMDHKAKVQSEEPDIIRACRALYAAIDRLDQAAADQLGIARSDLRCLNLLEHGPKRPGDIARELGLTTGSITALLDRLERKGLVARLPDPGDRRGLLISPTPELFAQLGPIYRTVAVTLTATVEGYDRVERQQAVRHLGDVTRACATALARLQPSPPH
jgi:DNA-binding MarR family transcriptional regulator